MFQEPGALPFTPKSIRSHFQHVFIIVQVHEPCTDKTYYRSVKTESSLGLRPLAPITDKDCCSSVINVIYSESVVMFLILLAGARDRTTLSLSPPVFLYLHTVNYVSLSNYFCLSLCLLSVFPVFCHSVTLHDYLSFTFSLPFTLSLFFFTFYHALNVILCLSSFLSFCSILSQAVPSTVTLSLALFLIQSVFQLHPP